MADSYAFSRINHIWGWATWRRSWANYDVNMATWPSWYAGGGLAEISNGSKGFYNYWKKVFENTYAGNIDTWDYQWTFACWANNGLTVMPGNNLTSNLGFSGDATHTTGEAPAYVIESIAKEIQFPLDHPEIIEQNLELDRIIDREVFLSGQLAHLKLLTFAATGLRVILRKIKRVLSRARF